MKHRKILHSSRQSLLKLPSIYERHLGSHLQMVVELADRSAAVASLVLCACFYLFRFFAQQLAVRRNTGKWIAGMRGVAQGVGEA